MSSKIKTYTRVQIVEAQQFFLDEALKGNVPPGVLTLDDWGRREDGTFGKLPDTYWIQQEHESFRLKDTDWVVFDPLLPGKYWYFPDAAFRAQFTEKK